MKTMNLQGDQLDLFNEIINLDNESIAKVKKYIKRITYSNLKTDIHDIDNITEEEIDSAMYPITHLEKIERLQLSEADPVCYTHDEIKKAVASWRNHSL